jgi:hypothetical protein
MLPNFLIIGAMKSGTTALYSYMFHHPQIFMSAPKELRYFVTARNWKMGREWYEGHFANADGAIAIGEGSPIYTRHPHHSGVPARIKELIPDVRLIYVIRNPIDRIRSEYLGRVVNGGERRPFDEAVIASPYYVDGSSYAMQIEQYLDHFSLDQFLIFTSEELRNSRAATMKRVFRFLSVDENWTSPTLHQEHHRTEEKRLKRPLSRVVRRVPALQGVGRFAPRFVKQLDERLETKKVNKEQAQLSEGLRQQLADLLRDDVKRLYAYMPESFDGWGIA